LRFAVRVERTGALLASDVDTAASIWTRFRGLMGRAGLRAGEGLWFPGDSSIHMLFMRFAIDAIFLAPDGDGREPSAGGSAEGAARADGSVAGAGGAESMAGGAGGAWRVVAIRHRLRPWVGIVWYVRGARGCLELDAGAAAGAGLLVGDRLRFEP
jgi:uncharacterized membrane protein (UPF0127 family)